MKYGINIKKIILTALIVAVGVVGFTAYAAAPFPPTNISAVAGDSSATIYFTPDASTSFDLNTEYTVSTVVSGPAPVQFEIVKNSPITIRGLVNGQPYKFVVTAKNQNGTSAKSAESNTVVPQEAEGETVITDHGSGAPSDNQGSNDLNIHIRYVNPIKANNIQSFLAQVIDSAILILSPIIVIMILWTGFLFVSARGNPEAIAGAKKALLYTLIGAAVILIAKGLSLAIKDILGQF